MSRLHTRCERSVERTLWIGLGIKRSSQGEEGHPQPLALQPSLLGREANPLGPLLSVEVFRVDPPLSSFHARLVPCGFDAS
jgi:hypothetical protein